MHPLKEKMIDKLTDMPPEFVEVVDKHFWELIDNCQKPQVSPSNSSDLLSEENNKTEYVKREDGEGFEVPLREIYRIACCDCGLVHDVVFVYEDGKLGMAAKRNNAETGRRRINKKT